MNTNTLEILMSLMEEFDDSSQSYEMKRPLVAEALVEAGFEPIEVHETLDWLDGFTIENPNMLYRDAQASQHTNRIYSPEESLKIDFASQCFLATVVNLGILDTISRELVIDKIMSCEAEVLDLSQVQWITFMVLANQPGRKVDSRWLEAIIMHSSNPAIASH